MLILTLLFVSNVHAIPIQFIFTGTGTGTIGQTSFTNSSFTITEQSDTINLQSCGTTCSFINANSTSISISGIGTYSFFTGTRTFDNTGLVGFSRAGLMGGDLYDSFNVGISYDMLSLIGPVAGTASLIQWVYTPVISTSGGILNFNTDQTQGTFQAIAGNVQNIPEPATLALLFLGLAGMGIGKHRISRSLA